MTDQRFHTAVQHFNVGEYFEAHEVWEDLWNESNGARHAFLQCLIQVAVALHHGRNGNWPGSKKLLAGSLNYLEKGRTAGPEVDLDALRDHVLDFALAIQQAEKGETVELPFFALPLK